MAPGTYSICETRGQDHFSPALRRCFVKGKLHRADGPALKDTNSYEA